MIAIATIGYSEFLFAYFIWGYIRTKFEASIA